MLEEDRNCFDVLTQMKAAKSSLNAAMEKYAEEHFLDCIRSCDQEDKEKMKKLLIELTKK